MTYEQALAWLDSLESLGIRPGLDRITALLARLGDPQRDLRFVLVAGTNGKGSVVAFLSQILREAGLRPGVYTSPHLVRFEERIAIDGAPIPAAAVAELTTEVRDAVEGVTRDGAQTPTYFEATTALAFLHLHRSRVPIAVLEVGMGGRFDATNVGSPLACAITPVSLDHTQGLGRTVAEIATQKAGIIRSGVPVVVARQEDEAMQVIAAEAAAAGAPLVAADSCRIEPRDGFPDPPRFSLTTPDGERHADLALALRGDHQVGNATLAVLLAGILRRDGGLPIDERAIRHGLATAQWPGRLELLPAAGNDEPDLLLDGAHNPDGCAMLAAYLHRHQATRPRRVLLFAAMRDKPADEMLRILKPVVDEVVVTGLPVARGRPPADLERQAKDAGFDATCEPDQAAALALARRRAGARGLVVASGSLYLVGEIQKNLRL
ncbi:MAG TPA: folylpolyglutamate synthase/dihydrofolate synthase family protein [Patescibacteria group bacterium]|nr:folylpolyglutamate synthase/dihydrofolate synthase family protein [Patescibacteria group bacterium]